MMEFFYFKKLVATLVSPVPIGFALLTLAMLAAWLTGASRWVKWPATLAWVLLGSLSVYTVAASWLLRYESLYPAFDMNDPRPVEQIIVLGCFGIEDPLLPVSSQLAPCSLVRLVEGMRIWRKNPQAEFILSGGPTRFGQISNAQMGANLLTDLGVPEKQIQVLSKARDTNSEAAEIKPFLSTYSPVLVTSATHMKRAVRIFGRHGISVIAAPSEHLVRAPSGQQSDWRQWVPDANNLYRSERAWYATLGNTLVTIQGMMGVNESTHVQPSGVLTEPVVDAEANPAPSREQEVQAEEETAESEAAGQ
ncbi:ElyC/SanA/YdcF family protein [Echinimonas agarilytica]|uniref:YdcF family protein n=1 Tax=Echinimonas agarilytica TaxID=1215918 RepID=A0AA42B8D6_9GAMM|nr:ElyC/SanA/YdcF family protein [Echinimonas agarilytica]MCM2680408.1 YdcF family protein [Echinimonas agarilytica]